MRKHFNELFSIQNGMITPRFQVQLGGVILGTGASFGPGALISGINLFDHTNSYFDVNIQNGIYVINGIYN